MKQTGKSDRKKVLKWTINEEEISNYFGLEWGYSDNKVKIIMNVLAADPSNKEREKFKNIDKIAIIN